jgi:hypothetical protein
MSQQPKELSPTTTHQHSNKAASHISGKEMVTINNTLLSTRLQHAKSLFKELEISHKKEESVAGVGRRKRSFVAFALQQKNSKDASSLLKLESQQAKRQEVIEMEQAGESVLKSEESNKLIPRHFLKPKTKLKPSPLELGKSRAVGQAINPG